MRRREYLRSTVGAAGLAGAFASTATAAGSDDAPSAQETETATPTGTPGTATGTSSDGFGPLARLDISNDGGGYRATEAVTTPDGRYAFVSKIDGFHVVDLADPANPEIVATREDILPDRGPMTSLFDIQYDSGQLVVATEGGSPITGIAVFDVRDPTEPELFTAEPTAYSIHNFDIEDGYAYLTTGSGMEVIDVSTTDAQVVGGWSVLDYDGAYDEVPRGLRNLHDLYVQDGRAYLAYWDAGTWVLDVSEPSEPSYLGHVADYTVDELTSLDSENAFRNGTAPPGNDHYSQPNDDGTLLAVGKESWAVSGEDGPVGGPSGIALWDIEDPGDPEELATIDPPPTPEGESALRSADYYTTAHNFDIAGDYLYSSWYRGGVRVHDISDPTAPEQVAGWADGETTSFWTAGAAVPGDFFVASSYEHPTDPDGPGGFFTFPDPTDNDATHPTQSTVSMGGSDGSSGSTPTATAAATPTEDPTATTATTAETTDGSGPGFGPLAALAGLGAGAWRLLGDNESDAE